MIGPVLMICPAAYERDFFLRDLARLNPAQAATALYLRHYLNPPENYDPAD
jgi:hypothetical protein